MKNGILVFLHVTKPLPKYLCLYPWTSTILTLDQRWFFLLCVMVNAKAHLFRKCWEVSVECSALEMGQLYHCLWGLEEGTEMLKELEDWEEGYENIPSGKDIIIAIVHTQQLQLLLYYMHRKVIINKSKRETRVWRGGVSRSGRGTTEGMRNHNALYTRIKLSTILKLNKVSKV